MSKDDELVLVVPSNIIFEKEKWQGLKTDNLEYYLELIKKNYFFKRRGDVENDPSLQQIIPYIIFSYQNKYFLYKYLPSAGEQRLIDTYQLGVGGHINPIDGNAGKDMIAEGTMREWDEEVDYKGNILEKKIIGILNDDSRPVEKVHLGLVYNFVGDCDDISIKEKDKMQGEMVELKDIAEKIKDNDGVWVKIVYSQYLKRLELNEFLKKYQQECKRTVRDFKSKEHEIMTWGLGIAGESGDVAGCIKKTYIHMNDQTAGTRENLGDVLWYVAMICNFYGWDIEDIFKENMEKLRKRYPDGFTEKDASRNNTRIDWNEKNV